VKSAQNSPFSGYWFKFAGQSYQATQSVAMGDNAGQVAQKYTISGYWLSIWSNKPRSNNQRLLVSKPVRRPKVLNQWPLVTRLDRLSQGSQSVAMGDTCGQTGQNAFSVAIGFEAGKMVQGSESVAVGYAAGQLSQNALSVAIGSNSLVRATKQPNRWPWVITLVK
jgi:hypothetical protein